MTLVIQTPSKEEIVDIDALKSHVRDQQSDLEEETRLEALRIEEEERLESIRFQAFVNTNFNLETGYGTSDLWLTQNNAGGIKCGIEYCSYPTQQSGLEALERLSRVYIDKYGYDFRTIRYVYCGSHCGEKDLNLFMELYNREYMRLLNGE